MAGGMITSAAKNGRKALDASINLVPFIDLLSCCISFLLITAVWVNLSQLPAQHGASGQGDTPSNEVQLTLLLDRGGYVLSRSTGESVRIDADADTGASAVVAGYKQLADLATRTKQELPTQDSVKVQVSDGVHYDHLIRTMDILRAAAFPNLHVSGGGDGTR